MFNIDLGLFKKFGRSKQDAKPTQRRRFGRVLGASAALAVGYAALPSVDISTDGFNEINSGFAPTTGGSHRVMSAEQQAQLRGGDSLIDISLGGVRLRVGELGSASEAHAQAQIGSTLTGVAPPPSTTIPGVTPFPAGGGNVTGLPGGPPTDGGVINGVGGTNNQPTDCCNTTPPGDGFNPDGVTATTLVVAALASQPTLHPGSDKDRSWIGDPAWNNEEPNAAGDNSRGDRTAEDIGLPNAPELAVEFDYANFFAPQADDGSVAPGNVGMVITTNGLVDQRAALATAGAVTAVATSGASTTPQILSMTAAGGYIGWDGQDAWNILTGLTLPHIHAEYEEAQVGRNGIVRIRPGQYYTVHTVDGDVTMASVEMREGAKAGFVMFGQENAVRRMAPALEFARQQFIFAPMIAAGGGDRPMTDMDIRMHRMGDGNVRLIGADRMGYDTFDTEAARRFDIWLAPSQEIAPHTVCKNVCGATADVPIMRGNVQGAVVRFDMERVDGNSRDAGTFRVLGETEAEDSAVFGYDRNATTFAAFQSSIQGANGASVADLLSESDLRALYEQGTANAIVAHDQLHDMMDAVDSTTVTMQPRLVPVDAATLAGYPTSGYDNSRVLFQEQEGVFVPTLQNVQIGGHSYTIQADYADGLLGGNPTQITVNLNGDMNAVDAPARMASVYDIVEVDGKLEARLVSGADVLANAEDCLDADIIESFIITQTPAPPPAASVTVGTPDAPAADTPVVPVDVSNIDVSVLEDCVQNIEGYNAQNSRVIKVEDGTTTRYYIARFGTDVSGDIDSNVTLLAGDLNADGHFVADEGARAISALRALGVDFDGAETNEQDRAEGREIFKQAREAINADIKRCAEGCPVVEAPAEPVAPAAPNLLTIDGDKDGRIGIAADGTLVDDNDPSAVGEFTFDRSDYDGLRDRDGQGAPGATAGGPAGGMDARFLYALGLLGLVGVGGAAMAGVSSYKRGKDAMSRARSGKELMTDDGRKAAGIVEHVGGAISGIGFGGLAAVAVGLSGPVGWAALAGGAAIGLAVGHALNRATSLQGAEEELKRRQANAVAVKKEVDARLNKITDRSVKARAEDLIEKGTSALTNRDKADGELSADAVRALSQDLWKYGKFGFGGRFRKQGAVKNFANLNTAEAVEALKRPGMIETINRMSGGLHRAVNG